MERTTYQRALHLWPEWERSIQESRKALGYDPRWPLERRMAWIEENYVDLVQSRVHEELTKLQSPPNLREYWEDCFYCEYLRSDRSVDFEKIRRRIGYEAVDRQGNKTGGWQPGNRSLPQLPFQASLTWIDDEDLGSPWVRIEIIRYAPLASRDGFESALIQAWRTFNAAGKHVIKEHPLVALISKAKSNASDRKRVALERIALGEVDFEGLSEEEWQTPQFRQELKTMQTKYRSNPGALKKNHREVQKKVYDRVRKWFPHPKPRVKGTLWRQRLPLGD